ncbi:MAG: winged helix-turn-helix transcriptional regulator [Spirochaetales bacterium]|nr:winged helix-turn-helix transcriptional regulator [Spirochaetales bacterium]
MDKDAELTKCSKAMSEWLSLSMQISFRTHSMFFKERGFSHSQIATLHMLSHRKECAVNDVSHMQSISNPAASQLLDQLVKRGFVERYESNEDRRIKYHKLTESGIKMMEESHSASKDWYQSLINDLSQEEMLLVTDALDILNKKIQVFKSKSKCKDCHKGDRS